MLRIVVLPYGRSRGGYNITETQGVSIKLPEREITLHTQYEIKLDVLKFGEHWILIPKSVFYCEATRFWGTRPKF